MIERPVFFGSQSNLLGVLTHPDRVDPDRPAVLWLNAGLLHRVGPNRLNVEAARRLGESGFVCMRFDMSGVGDSDLPGGGAILDIERSRLDVVEAMNALQERLGVDRFVVAGLCTGAYNAFRAALIDDRIVGCVLLDGYSYPTWRSTYEHYRTRVFELDRWTRYVKRRLGLGPAVTTGVGGEAIVFENEVVSKERFAFEASTLAVRGTHLLLIYTGLGPLAYYYPDQIFEAFPGLDLERIATVRFYPDADHTFTLPGNRRRLLTDIEAWMTEMFPADAAAGVA